MNSKSLATRMLMAMALTFGIQTSAQAQLGGLVNTVKRTVKDKTRGLVNQQKDKVRQEVHYQTNARIQHAANDVEHSINNSIDNAVSGMVSNAKSSVMSKGTAKMVAKIVGDEPPLPRLMSNEMSEKEIENFVWELRTCKQEDIQSLAEQLNARAKWDVSVVDGMEETKKIPMDKTLNQQLWDEMKQWCKFYIALAEAVSLHNSMEYQETSNNGWMPKHHSKMLCGMFVAGNEASQKGTIGKAITFALINGKSLFCTGDQDPRFAEDDEIEVARLDLNMMKNAATLLKGYPIEFANTQQKGSAISTLPMAYIRAADYNRMLEAAIKGNSTDNLEFHPMPKPGKLNSLKSQALAIEKKSRNDALDVVITRDAWEVKTNALGVPVCRVAYGYLIINTKHGKRALSYSWAQDHQGGGKYGALRHYGVGAGGSFYVK